MEASGPSKLKVKFQNILSKIKAEQIRSQVSGWQKILSEASTRLNDLSKLGVGAKANKSVSSIENDSSCLSSNNQDEEDFKDNSSTASGDTCVLAQSKSSVQETSFDESKTEMDEEEDKNLNLLAPAAITPRNRSPVTVQQWVDSLPIETPEPRREEEMPTDTEVNDTEVENLTLGAEAAALCRPYPPSVQITSCPPWHGASSDAGSHCSSMESLLEARKPDPEELLMELGFGGCPEPDNISRIPTRFLQPSQVKGVAVDDFIRHQQHLVSTFQSGFSGYRGLTGPSQMPSVIVGKIMERLREAEVGRVGGGVAGVKPPTKESPRLAKIAHNVLTKIRCVRESVLSPDNRRWLDSQGDKSPEPVHKRMIIGNKSFSFSQDGSLIETPDPREDTSSPDQTLSTEDSKEEKDDIEIIPVRKSLEEEQLEVEYRTISSLADQLSQATDERVEIGSEEHFFSLSSEERRLLEVKLIQNALETYQKRLKDLDLRSQFKDILNGKLNEVTDVLDTTTCPSLLTVLRQLTTLLRHQESLREELKRHEGTGGGPPTEIDLRQGVS